MKDPLISVVIPCFRSGRLLEDAIDSVIGQTERDWELILVDNNASDDTREVIRRYVAKYPEKIRTVHEPEQGNSSARNRGILEAKGVYVALLDDDDMMYPERLSLQKELMEKYPEASMCHGPVDKVSFENSVVIESSVRNQDLFIKHGLSHIGSTLFPCRDLLPSVMFFPKKKAIEVGLFDTHFNPIYLEDTHFCLKMTGSGSFLETDQALVRYRLPSSEYLKNKRTDNLRLYRGLLNQDYFFSEIVSLLTLNDVKIENNIKKELRLWKTRWLREASFNFMTIKGGERVARLFLRRALSESPFDFKSFKHYMRSFYTYRKRTKYYGKKEFFEEAITDEISHDFIQKLFNGTHKCQFCKNNI